MCPWSRARGVVHVLVDVRAVLRAQAGTRDGYTGWVIGGLYRYPPTDHPLCSRSKPDSEAGPVGPARAGVGGQVQRTYRRSRGRSPETTTPGLWPSGPASLSQACWGRDLASDLETARFDLNITKVSQNRGVSPEYAHKACHSPYFQNGPGKSALEIPRFPFCPAFSGKELMGLFDA